MKNLILILFIAFFSNACAQTPGIQWQKSIGGSGLDWGREIHQTSDGGFIVAGYSLSNDGNVTGNHGNYDYWIVKLNDTGAIQWQKSLGGSGDDEALSVQQTSDSGFIVAGFSNSNDGNVSGNHGGYDYWVVKLNDTGAILWQKSYGGSLDDRGTYIQQTTDGGYIVTGQGSSIDGDVTGLHGSFDYWVVKLNDTGRIEWQKSYGGSNYEAATSIQQLNVGGGFIMAGHTRSNDFDVSGLHGSADFWIVRINDTGLILWQRSMGGSNEDRAFSVQQTSDAGYIICGFSFSNDGDVSGNHGEDDFWIVKLNDSGAIQWEKNIGGSDYDEPFMVHQTFDGGYIIGGGSSSNDVDVSGNHGNMDYWVAKLNDTGAIQWQKSLGGSGADNAWSIAQTLDGGYITTGSSPSNNFDVTGNHGLRDYWVVKLTCGINPGTITGASTVCIGSSTTLIDTASGGVWSMAGSHATVSAGAITGVSSGIDTVYYSVTNTCGTAVASFPITVVSCPALGNIANTPSSITILPNPTTGYISITGATNTTIKIYNTIGQLIKSANNTDNISIAEFSPGLYFVRVFDDQGQLLKQEKVIKNP